MKVGDYIIVFDSRDRDFVLSGKIKNITANPEGYSVDGLLFFNPNSDKILINKVEIADNIININKIKNEYYTIIQHNNIDNTFEYDFFMWNEIEPEVKKICELLNKIDCIETYSSCNGHGKIPPYVDFYVKDWNKFLDLLEFLRNNNQSSKSIKHNDVESKHRFIIGVEGKSTVHLESLEVNSDFSELCKVLKRYLKKAEIA
jgi:hypothetical protein